MSKKPVKGAEVAIVYPTLEDFIASKLKQAPQKTHPNN